MTPEPRAPAAAGRMDCGVCWYRYDPGRGDPLTDVPPGTAFEELPEHWTCPVCDAPRLRFVQAVDGHGA